MTGKYQSHQEYKAYSSVFLESIPEHWEVKPLYSLCRFRQGKAHEPFVDDDGEFICVNARFISTQGGKIKHCTQNLTPAKPNDVLMVMSDLPNGRALAKAYFVSDQRKYAVNQRVCALTAEKVNAKFLYYQLDRSPYFLMYDDGANQTHLTNASYLKYPVLLPSLPEQRAIAAFLDRETGRIDRLIGKQERMIELLKEKRQAVISHAVTKGLNPDAPMKDSGVEWLGEIPDGWKVKRLKYLSSVNDETLQDTTPPNYELLYVDIGSVDRVDGIIKKESLLFAKSPSRARRRVKHDDTIISTVRTYLRAIAVVEQPEPNLIVSTGFAVVRPKNINPDYLGYALRSSFFVENVVARSTGISYPAINATDLIRIELVLPTPDEQKSIAIYLKLETTKIDHLITKAEQAIELMKERRTSLISAAVTGKIDVSTSLDTDVREAV